MGKAIGYIRCSTEEQADSRAGLDAQRSAILAEARRRGWDEADLTIVEDAGFSGRDLRRPGIEAALESLRHRKADTLVVSKLDRLSRSLVDFAGLMDRASREKWALIALDLNVDTSTPAGEAMAAMLATFAQFERRLIGERTKAALAMKRAAGVRLGRPRVIPDDVVERIRTDRASGLTLRSIADRLTSEAVPTAMGGGRWYVSTVQSVLSPASRPIPATSGTAE